MPEDATSSADPLELGRRSYAHGAWRSAYESLSSVESPSGEDLELLATAAGMLGRDDEYLGVLERAHHEYLAAGQVRKAVRCAFWIGTVSAQRGEAARATGWLGRAQRLLERVEGDCVERGYLMAIAMTEQEAAGDLEAALSIAVEGASIGERFKDPDLVALAMYEQGRLLTKQGRNDEGLGVLDEVMVAVSGGELSPMVTGILYCSVIDDYQRAYELRRAREWTAALTKWCEEQPDMIAFTGLCLVHRAEIMQVDGEWPAALEEARRAGRRFADTSDRMATGEAYYRQAEILRLQGENSAAEKTYREASLCGWEPQPGLAMLRLAQGDLESAEAAIRRVVDETKSPLRRAGLIPAYVEIMLAAGELEEAHRASRELGEIALGYRGGMLNAMVAQTEGAVLLAGDDARAALIPLREACRMWLELGARYEGARSRVLVGLSCIELGDEDAGEMELEAARRVFAELGALPDVIRTEQLSRRSGRESSGGLTAREMDVLRLVATGMSNRAIAEDLVISEKTVARHMSNIFTKLGLSSRSALTAYAYQHELVL